MKSLRSKLTAFVAVLLVVTAAAIAASIFTTVRSELLGRLRADVDNISAGYGLMIGNWIADRYAMMSATLPAIRLDDPLPMLNQTRASGQFDLVYIGYADQRTVFTSPQALPAGYDPTARPWYKDAQASATPILTAPYEDASTKQLVVSFAAALKEDGNTLGVIASDIGLDSIVKTVLSIRPLGSGYAFIVDDTGKILVHPDKALTLKPATELSPDLAAPALTPGRLIETRIGGNDSFVFLKQIEGAKWKLGLVIDRDTALHSLQTMLRNIVIALVIAMAVAIPLAGMLVGHSLNGLRRIRDAMREVASGGGDLTRRIEVDSHDEIGETADAFNRFQDQLRTMFRSVRDESGAMTSGVNGIHGVVRELANDSEQLSDLAGTNAATIEEITVSIAHIADHSSEANQLMADTERVSQESARQVDAVAAEIGRSADTVRSLATVLDTLNSRSQDISGIIGVIREIADQTNLLALNAAIEAARAGEQGRGFAVVADEVRKLAERTGQATVQITELINAMVGETKSASQAMGSTLDAVDTGVAQSRQAAEKIANIQQAMRTVKARMDEIALSTNEQKQATAQMAQGAEAITARMHESDQALQRARDALHELNETAARVGQLMSKFTI